MTKAMTNDAAARQHVCTACGYNLVARGRPRCPFCGSDAGHQLGQRDALARYRVAAAAVAPGINRLATTPRLGLEHAAYRIEHAGGASWIDCPSLYDPALPPVGRILFTHKDFLGASNLYRDAFAAEVWLHDADAAHPLAAPFPVDRRFTAPFESDGIRAQPLGGHSPGFTAYLFADTLFACDLVFDRGARTRFNPYGDGLAAARGAARDLLAWLGDRRLARVCGWNYVSDYAGWRDRVAALVARGRPVDRPGPARRSPAEARFLCERCALVYDPLLGMPEDGIAPGTPFADIPDDWRCPDCGVGKADFIALD